MSDAKQTNTNKKFQPTDCSDKIKEYISTFSHDLNNPLTILTNNTKIIKEIMAGGTREITQENLEFCKTLLEKSEQAIVQINDLLESFYKVSEK